MPKVALAYSGSLDTTICVQYLRQVKGMKVYTFSANLGQPEYLAPLAERAVELGAAAAPSSTAPSASGARYSGCPRLAEKV